jgi:hypothetical protein
MTMFYCLMIPGSPSVKGQVPVFISPRNRVVQLYPRALDSVFVSSYDPQDYGGVFQPVSTNGKYLITL